MWGGRAYRFHRHTGRMMRDSSMRMTNRAEVGFGMVGVMFFFVLVASFLILIF